MPARLRQVLLVPGILSMSFSLLLLLLKRNSAKINFQLLPPFNSP